MIRRAVSIRYRGLLSHGMERWRGRLSTPEGSDLQQAGSMESVLREGQGRTKDLHPAALTDQLLHLRSSWDESGYSSFPSSAREGSLA